MRIKGETIEIRHVEGGGFDPDGFRLPEEVTWETVNGCVIAPVSGLVMTEIDYRLAQEEVTVYAPTFITIKIDEEFKARGKMWQVTEIPFDHRSPFGTNRGGTEFKAKFRETI